MQNLIKQNFKQYLLYAFLITLFFSMAIPNILLGVLVVFSLIDFRSFKINKIEFTSTTVLFLLVLFLILKSIVFQSITYDFKIYKAFFTFFLIALIFNKTNDLNNLKLSLLIGINASILYSLILIALFFSEHQILPFSNTAEVNDLLLLERPYLGLVTVLGIILSIERAVILMKFRILWLLNALVLFLFVLLISARISIITVFVLVMVYLLFYLKVKTSIKMIFLTSLILIFGLIIKSNKNISDRFFIKNNIEQSIQVASDYEPRIVIWNCAYNITGADNFSFLIGFDSYETIANSFLNCYATTIENVSKKDYFLSEKFNSHNQFIDFFLIGGLIALLLFLVFFLKLFSEVKKDFFKTAIVISFLLFLCVENVFYRQLGCYLFGIFILVFAKKQQGNNE